VTPHMRAVLIDWLSDVAKEFGVSDDAQATTVVYLDRILRTAHVPRKYFQLFGEVSTPAHTHTHTHTHAHVLGLSVILNDNLARTHIH
jgi:hypothetical protein